MSARIRAPISAHEIRQAAAAVFADPRTIRAYVKGRLPRHPAVRARIEAGLRMAGRGDLVRDDCPSSPGAEAPANGPTGRAP